MNVNSLSSIRYKERIRNDTTMFLIIVNVIIVNINPSISLIIKNTVQWYTQT